MVYTEKLTSAVQVRERFFWRLQRHMKKREQH